MTKRTKVKPKLSSYHIISDAVQSGLRFALNRLEDHGVEISDAQRLASIDPMMNELMIALDSVIDWGGME